MVSGLRNAKRSAVRHILETAAQHAAELLALWELTHGPSPNDLTTDAEIDAALERSKQFDRFPTIVEAIYRAEPELRFLMLRLSDGQRLLIPREMLGELRNATDEQAANLEIGPEGLDIWWPQLDDGFYLPDFLQHRWENSFRM